MLKKELEKKCKQQENEIHNLKGVIKKYTQRAIDELDPCDDALELIDEMIAEAGLPERTEEIYVKLNLTVPARLAKKLMNDIDETGLTLFVNGEEECQIDCFDEMDWL